MDNYSNQSYFKALCDVSAVAYGELKRMKAETGMKCSERISAGDVDTINWYIRLFDTNADIASVILQAVEKKQTFIINKKEEVLALIHFFSNHYIGHYKIINETAECEQLIPDDKLTTWFMKAYKAGDNDEMVKIYHATFGEEI